MRSWADGSGATAVGAGGPRQNVVVCARLRPEAPEYMLVVRQLWRLDKAQSRIAPTEQHPSLARRAGSSTGAASPDDEDARDARGAGTTSSAYDFCFDSLTLGEERTDALYRTNVYPVVRAAMEGYNGTVFAYGQTGSGKTHTMSGTPEEPGVIPCAIHDVFAMIRGAPTREFLLRVSYLEIYNETLRDLLAPGASASPAATPRRGAPARPPPPRIVEEKGRVSLAALHEEVVTTPAQVLALLERGQHARHVGATDWNARSSRSHCVFQITIESRGADGGADADESARVRCSQLNLIDLAGSERAASEAARRKEGAYINKSLLTLGTVIAKLTEPSPTPADMHIPYRDSKLTRLLQTSLGGDARVAVICTLTLDPEHATESLSTLKFGRRCKLVVTTAQRQTVVDDKALLERYRREIESLRARLQTDRDEDVSSASDSAPSTPTPSTPPPLVALDMERAAAAKEVAAMEQTRHGLRQQLDHLTRLILTSRSVATLSPSRPTPAHAAHADTACSPHARRGPRMSDLAPRAHASPAVLRAQCSAPDTLALQQQAELAAARRQLREAQAVRDAEQAALETALTRAQRDAEDAQERAHDATRSLANQREEHANDAAHREFRDLVTGKRDGDSSSTPPADTAHLHARIAALERALAEERATRDMPSLPGRPRVSPMHARGGMTPPCVPLRSRSHGGSPQPESSDAAALLAQIEHQKVLIATLNASVASWQERVQMQSRMIGTLVALVEGGREGADRGGSEAEGTESDGEGADGDVGDGVEGDGVEGAAPDHKAQHAPGRLRTGLASGGKTAHAAASWPRPAGAQRADGSDQKNLTLRRPPERSPPTTTRAAAESDRAKAPLPASKERDAPRRPQPMPSLPSYVAAASRERPAPIRPVPVAAQRSDAQPATDGSAAAAPSPATGQPAAAAERRSLPTPRGAALHGSSARAPHAPKGGHPLPTPPGGTAPSGGIAALKESLLAPSQTSARLLPPLDIARGKPVVSEAIRSLASKRELPTSDMPGDDALPPAGRRRLPTSDMPSDDALPPAGRRQLPPSPSGATSPLTPPGGLHAPLQARLQALSAAADAPRAPRASASVRALPASKLASSATGLPSVRRRDSSVLRELNDLRAMPRVESSRTVYTDASLPSEATQVRLSGVAYKTDASAYYI
ncbi:hypothetical protein MSPP1_004171 [Malassezia sp. CBS 17886]|nr:hypothetical protein MSPP1_004171 [Malassezia sp. CBS 17886]